MAAGSDEGTPARRHLVEECATLRRLLYCNNRQHRRHKTMGRLRAVLSKAELLIAAVSLAAPTGRRDGKGSGERAKLLRLARFIVVEVDFAVMRCAADLAGMLSRALYVPLALAASASVARIFALERKLLLETVHRYNKLSNEASTSGAADREGQAASEAALPQSLRCVSRSGSRIRLKEFTCSGGGDQRDATAGGAASGARPPDLCDLGEELNEDEIGDCILGGVEHPVEEDGETELDDEQFIFWEDRGAGETLS